MRRKPFRRASHAGSLFAASEALRHQTPIGSLPASAHLASVTGAVLVSMRQWIQLALAHISPAQLVEGVVVAWFIFVLALLSLTRAAGAEPPECVSPIGVSLDDEYDNRDASNTAVGLIQAGGIPDWSSLQPPMGSLSAAPGLDSGHLLALIGIAASGRRRMPYGLFLGGEFLGASSDSGDSCRRTVDVMASQIALLPASDTVLSREHLSALFEMAVARAKHVLRYNSFRTEADLEALVAGIVIMGNNACVVNVGHCRAYLFRPSTGLIQITIDFLSFECRLVPPGGALPARGSRSDLP